SARPSGSASRASEQSSRRLRRSLSLFYTAAMKRSLQEYVELVVFGLVALLVGTGLLWLVGWVLSLGGIALRWVAGLLWTLLRFIVPVAIAGGLVYFLVKAAQDRQPKPAAATVGAGAPGAAPPPPAGGPQGPAAAPAQGGDSETASATASPSPEATGSGSTTTAATSAEVEPDASATEASDEPASGDDRA